MSTERDPRVVKVAEALALAYPYGFERVKNGPSGADYHAAIVAVRALDEMDEWEYAVQGTHIEKGFTYTETWYRRIEYAEASLGDFLSEPHMFGMSTRKMDFGDFKIVKRRKAGKVEEL